MTVSPSTTKAPGSSAVATTRPGAPALMTSEGTTTIADSVVQKIAGMAASDVSGVYQLGGSAAAAFSSLKNRLPGSSAPSVTQGISVEVGQTEATVEVALTTEYGVAIQDVAASVRRNIISAVGRMTGLTVTTVDVTVSDVHLPTDSSSDSASS